MFEWAKFLSLVKRFKFNESGISFFGFNKLMVTDGNLSLMVNSLSKKNKLALYEAAKRVAFEYGLKLIEEMNAPGHKVVAEWGAKAFSLMGYGKCEANVDNYRKEIRTTLFSNPLALSSEKKVKVDWLARGYAAGVAQAVFGVPCDCIELSCMAEGADTCEFIAGPSSDFDFKDELVKSQLK